MAARLASYNPDSAFIIGAGLSLAIEFGINPGLLNFFGKPTSSAGKRGNIGASEMRTVATVSATCRS